VLKFVASIIAAKVRASDIVGRWGGEELVALLVGANERDGFLKAEEIRKAVRSRVRIPRTNERITVSIGVAELDGDTSFDELVKRADAAMYRAKSTGRDRVMRFSDL
jgi:diguanylate cyclase (GGDEF)-like protein